MVYLRENTQSPLDNSRLAVVEYPWSLDGAFRKSTISRAHIARLLKGAPFEEVSK